MKGTLAVLLTLTLLLMLQQTWRWIRHPAYSWPELPQLRELNCSPSRGGTWEHRAIIQPRLAEGELLQIVFGCGGGSNDYCQVLVTRDTQQSEDLLRFGGNCDVLPWQRPRIYLEPMVPGKNRRFLTYHKHLVNDSIGEGLKGGYWLWTWNGVRFQPQRLSP